MVTMLYILSKNIIHCLRLISATIVNRYDFGGKYFTSREFVVSRTGAWVNR